MKMNHRIDSLLSRMTIKQKVGQLNQEILDFKRLDEIKEKIRNGEIGSLILADSAFAGHDKFTGASVKVLNELQRIAMEESECKIPIIYGKDVIHGYIVVFPVPLAMAASFNMPLIKEGFSAIAEAAASDGIHWSFAPMLDLSRDPRWGRIIESPGEDPYLGAQIAKAIVEGFQGEDLSDPKSIAACAKHYIGYGASEGGRDYHKAEISDYTLRNYYLSAFEEAVKSKVSTVMTSFNEISGQPVSSSHYLLTELLKNELGFEGFIISDWEAIKQLKKQGVADSMKGCVNLAFNAGLDMDMVDRLYIQHLEELVEEGEVSMEALNESVRRVLNIKLKLGLFNHPYTEYDFPDRSKLRSLSREAARESMVLLKNDNNVLPLKKNAKIALIGPMVNERRALLGAWTLDYDIDEVKTFKEAFPEIAPEADWFTCNSGLLDDELRLIRRADVVVLALGESHEVTGEARSVTSIELPLGQAELIRKVRSFGKPVVGVICCGRPVALENVQDCLDAILYAWHGGSQTAYAAADILFGDVCPSGKTPVTFPRVTGQIPIYYNHPSSGRAVNGYYGEEAINNYEDCLGSPLYPFGYGLSYTSFEYTECKLSSDKISLEALDKGDTIKASVSVTNTGNMDGKEIIQCYIRDICASMTRPVRELKKFEKILIRKGQTVDITFELGKEELGFYNKDGRYIVEKGEFEVYIGENCLTQNKVVFELV